AENQAASLRGRHQAKSFAQADRRVEPGAREGLVERLFRLPTIEANTDLTAAVEQATGDKVARVGDEIDHGAVGRFPFNSGDRARIDPGVPAIKRPSPLRQED